MQSKGYCAIGLERLGNLGCSAKGLDEAKPMGTEFVRAAMNAHKRSCREWAQHLHGCSDCAETHAEATSSEA